MVAKFDTLLRYFFFTKKSWVLSWVFACLHVFGEARELDLEYWQLFRFQHFEKGPLRFYTSGDLRFRKDAHILYHYRITGNLAYTLFSWLDLEAHYSHVRTQSSNVRNWRNAHQIELEINPSLKLNDCAIIRWRNRFQLMKRQKIHLIYCLFRHRMAVIFPLKNKGRLTEMKCYNEIFYDLRFNQINQNRFVPLEMTFTFDKLNLSVFVMWQKLNIHTPVRHDSLCLGSEINL